MFRLMQIPAFARWMASAVKDTMQNPNAVGNWLGRLGSMQFDRQTQPLVNAYLQGQGQQMPANQMPGQ
jgi:hypothetical protein